jgi:HSP20 family molecular chaperone IbpA
MNSRQRNSWMWAEACALLEQAERRHRHFFELLEQPSSPPVWEPPVNLFAVGSELQVAVALPGARQTEVAVRLEGSRLEIEAVVTPPVGSDMQVLRLEIPYGRMRRRIELPHPHYSLAEHRLESGCLFLRLQEATS